MACALTQGYTLDCKDNIGGISEVYFAPLADIATITETAGVVTALTMDAGKFFYKYQLVRETSNFNEVITSNVQNGTIFYAQTVEIILNKLQVNTRNEILLLAKNHLAVIVVDLNGNKWFLGKQNGMDLTGGGSNSGTAFGDRNGYTLTFTASEKELAPSVTAVIPIPA